MDSNDELRNVYKTLATEIVDAVNADYVNDCLFAAKVLSAADYDLLSDISERKKKARKLLTLLHNGRHPEAFIKLHETIKTHPAHDWLAKQVDDLVMSSTYAATNNSKHVEQGLKHVAIIDDDRRSVVGVTSIDSRLFVLRSGPIRQKIQVYDTKTFKQQEALEVKGLSDDRSGNGLTACVTNNCLFVSDSHEDTVHKVELSDNNKVTSWHVGSGPNGLSINTACNLIVACGRDGKIQEYNATNGSLVREISLDSNDIELCPLHAIQLDCNQFVVSHYCWNNRVSDVVEVDAERGLVVSYRNQLNNSETYHVFNWPGHLSVDSNNEFILVADMHNNKIVILNRSSKCCARILHAKSVDGGLDWPSCLYLNVSQNRLFVGEGAEKCRILVFDNVT